MKLEYYITFLLTCFLLFISGFLIYESEKPLCPEYYSLLYLPNGSVMCVAPEPPKKQTNPSVYDPKNKGIHK